MLIINADDWGRSREETERARECYANGRITSVTAMVFMQDSERAADLARKDGMAVGLHLNLSESFTGENVPAEVVESNRRVSRFLKQGRFAPMLYNPFLRKDFRRLYLAQAQEFGQLYGTQPTHVDGHQHLHLCANVLFGNVITRKCKVRRNLSFWPGEKSWLNRTCRRASDRVLTRRYSSTDYFFCLSRVLETDGLERVIRLARTAVVELMVHPIRGHEYAWLMSERCPEMLEKVQTGNYGGATLAVKVETSSRRGL